MKTKLTAVALLAILLPASAPFWMNYAHGYGGQVGSFAATVSMLLVSPLILVMLLALIWAVIESLVSVVRRRPVGFVVLKIGIVVSLALTLVLPSYVAKPMKWAGALARVSASGGEHFLSALREEAAILWKQAERDQQDNLLVTNLPPVLAQAGVGIAHFQVVGDGRYRLDAITSGRPHPGGWIITSGSEVQESSPTEVKVAENIYRY